tara:strand:+ start:3492 stop:3746 length:255 start_codon:yes stop_codon:yes gene_type:complete
MEHVLSGVSAFECEVDSVLFVAFEEREVEVKVLARWLTCMFVFAKLVQAGELKASNVGKKVFGSIDVCLVVLKESLLFPSFGTS